MATEPGRGPTVTVVICAYTEKRWEQILSAVESVWGQSRPPEQCIVVIDHNDALFDKSRRMLEKCDVVPNAELRGLSGARNTGVMLARGEVVAFLDDDASADPLWLEHLLRPYRDPTVIGTGGAAEPGWPDQRPTWFPPEFDWVVGCSYRGLPERETEIRNPIGANMSFRRETFRTAGGFDSDIGRLGNFPLGCEETVFSIRALRATRNGRIVYVPEAVVRHAVSSDRVSVKYFLRRCVAEGLSKAIVTRYVGQTRALASERRYASRVLPRGVVHGLRSRHAGESPRAAAMILVGFMATAAGYVFGRMGLARPVALAIGR